MKLFGTSRTRPTSRIRKVGLLVACCIVGSFVLASPAFCEGQRRLRAGSLKTVQLSPASLSGPMSLEEAIGARRSVRQFAAKPLNFAQIGQLCWAGQGVTDKQQGLRAAPSAGALYPIELYLVTTEGLFIYRPGEHSLEQVSPADLRRQLSAAGQGQEWIAEAPCSIVVAGAVRKVAGKYGSKATRYMLLEAGHVSENIQLQAAALGLACVPIGAFDVKNVAKVCQLPGDLEPLLVIPVGHPLVAPAAKKAQGQSQPSDKTATAAKKAVLIVPAANFRDEEFFETQRVLTEAGIETAIASTKIGPLQGMLGGIVASELLLDKVRVDDFDAVVFIGGPGATEYFTNAAALGIAREAAAKRKVLAAISTAPAILADAGVLRGVRATGFLPQREAIMKGGAEYTGAPVERDGLVITASGPLAVIPFAQTIASTLQAGQLRSGKNPG